MSANMHTSIEDLYLKLVKVEEEILLEMLTKRLGHEPSIDEMKKCQRIFFQGDTTGKYQFSYMGENLGTMHKMFPSVSFPVFKLCFHPADGSKERLYSCQVH